MIIDNGEKPTAAKGIERPTDRTAALAAAAARLLSTQAWCWPCSIAGMQRSRGIGSIRRQCISRPSRPPRPPPPSSQDWRRGWPAYPEHGEEDLLQPPPRPLPAVPAPFPSLRSVPRISRAYHHVSVPQFLLLPTFDWLVAPLRLLRLDRFQTCDADDGLSS